MRRRRTSRPRNGTTRTAEARRFAARVLEQFTRFDLLTYASAIAFQVLYAVVPLALLGLAGLGLFGRQSVYAHHIAPTLRHDLSPQAFTIADRTARKVMDEGKVYWSTAGLALTLWGVSASLRAMMVPLNAVYGTKESRSWVRRLLDSLAGAVAVIVCVFSAILVVLAGRLFAVHGAGGVLSFLVRWLIALVLLLLANVAILRVVPSKRRPIEWVTVGSLFATVCWVVATLAFGAYVSTVSYTSFYGALASIVILLVYLHVSAIAFLLGVAVDAIFRDEKTSRR